MLEITKPVHRFLKRFIGIDRLEKRLERMQDALGRIEARQCHERKGDWKEHEFQVYSQWGEDGLIDYITQTLGIEAKRFVEFGVEDYTEANTRFLLTQRGWSGLIIDGSESNIAAIKKSDVYWRYNLKVARAFITRENINDILIENGMTGKIGLLSIDIDGNDYWVWEAVSAVEPDIVVIEYNYRFGKTKSVTIPYRPEFQREHSELRICFGASLKALTRLAERKGYVLIGTNTAGLNAFFLHATLISSSGFKPLTAEEAYREGTFKDYVIKDGRPVFFEKEQEMAMVQAMPLAEV